MGSTRCVHACLGCHRRPGDQRSLAPLHSLPRCSKPNKQASQQENKQTHQDFFSNFFFIIATGRWDKQANKTSKQANKETNEHTKISSQLFLHNCDWSGTSKQTRENKQASQQTNKRRCLLKLFLHNCDWSGIQFHKQTRLIPSTYLPQCRAHA